jgi:hypothetical protein
MNWLNDVAVHAISMPERSDRDARSAPASERRIRSDVRTETPVARRFSGASERWDGLDCIPALRCPKDPSSYATRKGAAPASHEHVQERPHGERKS